MAYPTNLKSRLAKLESELMGPSDATLEELVLASMRPDLCDAETARRIETSRLARLSQRQTSLDGDAIQTEKGN
jgi:hypothetical protein